MNNLRDESREPRGRLHIKAYRKGRLILDETEHNLIVDLGRSRMAALLGGTTTDAIKYVGVGTGSNAPSVLDEVLTDCVLSEVVMVDVRNSEVKFDFKIDQNTANGLAIREFGLFTADGLMFSHRVRAGCIDKDSEVEIYGDWTIQF